MFISTILNVVAPSASKSVALASVLLTMPDLSLSPPAITRNIFPPPSKFDPARDMPDLTGQVSCATPTRPIWRRPVSIFQSLRQALMLTPALSTSGNHRDRRQLWHRLRINQTPRRQERQSLPHFSFIVSRQSRGGRDQEARSQRQCGTLAARSCRFEVRAKSC